MPSHVGDILIAGAGVAGLSAAIALKLAGFAPAIFEREATLEPIGAGLQLGPNATRLLAAWGVDMGRAACEPERLCFYNLRRGGAALNHIPLGATARARYGAPYITILRADLQEALLRRVADLGIPMRYDARVSEASAHYTGVEIEAGGMRHVGSALIGADGLRSAVRGGVPGAGAPHDMGMTAWRATLAPHRPPEVFQDNNVGLWVGSGAHLVHYPVGGASILNAVFIVENDWRTLPLAEDGAAFLRQRFMFGAAEEVRTLIDAAGEWQAWPIWALSPLASFYSGRVALAGDAAHAIVPFMASGGAMAIEDAAALAAALKRETDVPAAFALYDTTRRRRVARVAYRSLLMGRIYHFPDPGGVIRNAVIGTLSPSALLARNDWLYQHDASAL
jgi:salicylate hydroxylase